VYIPKPSRNPKGQKWTTFTPPATPQRYRYRGRVLLRRLQTAWCWGFGWGDDVIDAKTRSMMNLAMIGALGKMAEWETHCRGAISNGVTQEEIRAIIHVIGIYCGVPQALECFRVARNVLSETQAN